MTLHRSATATLRAALSLTAALAAAGTTACADLETVSPAGTTTDTTGSTDSTASTETATETDTTAPPDPAIPKRTVMVRNPLGQPANNLLADGDFELSTPYGGGGQHAFRMFSANGTTEIAMQVETGGLCRSGLTCVKIQKGQLLFGRGTAAAGGKGHVFSMYAKVPADVPCNKITPVAVECDSFDVLAKADPVEGKDADWCRYEAAFKPSKAAVCVYIQSSLQPDQVAIVDAAVLGPDDGTVPFKAVAPWKPDAETVAEMARLRDFVRRTTPFGKPLPGRTLPSK